MANTLNTINKINTLRQLKNHELTEKFTALVASERKVCHLVLQYINEIERRKLYLERAYPSLFEFLVREHKYSEGAAQRRIASARLLREVPEIASELQSGKLNLSQLSQVQQAVNLVRRTQQRQVTSSEKSEILKKIEGSSKLKTQKILSEALDLPLPIQDQEQQHRDDSVTLTLTFSVEEMKVLQQARELSSAATSSLEWKALIVHLAEKEVRGTKRNATGVDRLLRRQAKECGSSVVANGHEPKFEVAFTAAVAVETKDLPRESPGEMGCPISANKIDRACSYRDPQTHRVCGARAFLSVDHIQPRWAGGSNESQNLRIFCQSHNRVRYHRQAQITRR